jgi:hypothetical protein
LLRTGAIILVLDRWNNEHCSINKTQLSICNMYWKTIHYRW